MALRNLLPPEYFDPVTEVIDHVHELAVYDESSTTTDIVDRAFDELENLGQPITLEVLSSVMYSVFGSQSDAQSEYQTYSESEVRMLYPGITAQLLNWYVQKP